MTTTINIGSSALEALAAPNFVTVYVQPGGAGTNILVNSGDTISYYTQIDSNATPAGTIAVGANQTFTAEPLWITSAGLSNVTFSGPGY